MYNAFKLLIIVPFLFTEGNMGQDPGNEVPAAEDVFHFEQVAPGLTPLNLCTWHFIWFLIIVSLSDAELLVRITNSNVFCAVLFQGPTKTRFCIHDKEIEQAYDDLLDSSKQTLSSMLELQEVPAYPFNFGYDFYLALWKYSSLCLT